MNFEEILELYRRNTGLTSWPAVAESMGMSKANLNFVRSGKVKLQERTVSVLMEGTGLEAPEIEAAWKAIHSEDPKVRDSWARWLSRRARNSAALLLALSVVFSGQITDFQGGRSLSNQGFSVKSEYYVNS
ncbi:hypothetical protein L0E83_08885 [Marichromatium gracile]|uniref:hypothetical protein n=1 Tax=Marichromatium gracile TaxID=1048 RepID=UPI001F2EAF14|nr:hypothetical protein [Marichromatium gracile]MCF1183550.1 hypothetical protein [Marichromatium gracile]